MGLINKLPSRFVASPFLPPLSVLTGRLSWRRTEQIHWIQLSFDQVVSIVKSSSQGRMTDVKNEPYTPRLPAKCRFLLKLTSTRLFCDLMLRVELSLLQSCRMRECWR